MGLFFFKQSIFLWIKSYVYFWETVYVCYVQVCVSISMIQNSVFFMCFFLFFHRILEYNLKQRCNLWRYQRNCCSGTGWFYFCQTCEMQCVFSTFSKVWYQSCGKTWLPFLFAYTKSIAMVVESKPVFVVRLLNADLLPCWKGQSSLSEAY